jgi:hypothetical protein
MAISRTGLGERRKNKRLYARMITVDFDGEFYATRDWSLGGFLIDGYDGALEPAQTVRVGIILEDGTRTYERAASASVVRTDRENQRLAAKFDAMDDDAVDLLDGWQSGRLRRRPDPTSH